MNELDSSRGVRPSLGVRASCAAACELTGEPRSAAAFTIIEVLMAVLILGIGLLGLGAVLPAVVKQQQASTLSVRGAVGASAARAVLLGGREGADDSQRIVVRIELDQNGQPKAGQTFALAFNRQRTADIPITSLTPSVASVADALRNLGSLSDETGDAFLVSGSTGTNDGMVAMINYDITFRGKMGRGAVQRIETDGKARFVEFAGRVGAPDVGPAFWRGWAEQDPAIPPLPGSPPALPADGSWLILQVDTSVQQAGALHLGQNSNGLVQFPIDRTLSIQLGDRLFPSDAASGTAGVRGVPEYVWDIAVRRLVPFDFTVPGATWDQQLALQSSDVTKVQVAVFVRRLDGKIKPPTGKSLVEALVSRKSAPDQRWPVSVDSTGVPTNDGRTVGGFYSTPMVLGASFAPTAAGSPTSGKVQVASGARDRLVIDTTSPPATALPAGVTAFDAKASFQLIARPGQMLIDNLGNVYTVKGVDVEQLGSNAVYAVRLTTPVPLDVVATQGGVTPPGVRMIRQVLFVPQVPVAAFVEVPNS